MSTFGRLETVDLRQGWQREDTDFTPWLAREENISLLGEAIGMELEVDRTEAYVGPFRADILAKDTTTGANVLIENQLERTDHGHLGQLLTYAAGLNTVTIVWIAAKFTDEHRAALDWLNSVTNDDVSFFGLEIELLRISDSPCAPRFNVVAKPNSFTRSVSEAVHAPTEFFGAKPRKDEYWSAFKVYLEEKRSSIRLLRPPKGNWVPFSLQPPCFRVFTSVDFHNKKKVAVGLMTTGPDAKRWFEILQGHEEEIHRELGFELSWQTNEQVEWFAKYWYEGDLTVTERTNWPELHEWVRAHLEKLGEVLRPRVKTLQLEPTDSEEAA